MALRHARHGASLWLHVFRLAGPHAVGPPCDTGRGFSLEGAADNDAMLASLQRFVIQGLHLAQAQRCALSQRRAQRRLRENDAWLVATAESLDADVVGTDRQAFERLGERYLRFR